MTSSNPSFAWVIIDYANTISSLFFPIGLISVSIYLVMTESVIRRKSERGFEVG